MLRDGPRLRAPRRAVAAVAAVAAALLAAPAGASLETTLTAAPDFDPATVERIAVVTVACHEALHCGRIEDRVQLEVADLGRGLIVVPPVTVRAALFRHGVTAYDPELRAELAAELDVDALVELDVPFGEKGVVGERGSQVKVELRLVSPAGAILAHGVGTARIRNTLTGPERAAGNVVAALLAKVFR